MYYITRSDGSFLVVSEAWYPGWTATIGDRQVPIEIVNGYVQGMRLQKPGPQRVLLEYNPILLRQGFAGSIIGLVLTIALCFWKIGDRND